jgi:hypothetical protein
LQIPSRLITPNLHIAVCHYLDQELETGPMALQTEFWVERCMDTAKPSRRALHAEKTMVKTSEAIGRVLTHNAVYHGCITAQEMRDEVMVDANQASVASDPAAATQTGIHVCFQGIPFRGTETSALVRRSGCCFEDCTTLLAKAADTTCTQQIQGWLGLPQMSTIVDVVDMAAAMMQHVSVISFDQCRLPHFTVCTPSKGNSHRVEASGWVEARSLDAPAADKMGILHVQCFVLLQRRHNPQSTPMRLAFVKHSPDWVQDNIGGGVCYKAPDSGQARIALIQVSSMHAPCLLVNASNTAGSTLRLVPIHGKRL